MTIEVRRDPSRDGWTRGQLFIDGVFVCWTCEDVIRDTKVAHQTAIPPGRYEVVLTHSRRFGQVLPELRQVPSFSAVRLHAGNTAAQSSGCLLVGLRVDARGVWHSRAALRRVQARIASALAQGDRVWITVVNPGGTPDGLVRLDLQAEAPEAPAAAPAPSAVPGAPVGLDR